MNRTGVTTARKAAMALSLTLLSPIYQTTAIAQSADPGPHYFVTDEVNTNQFYWREEQGFAGSIVHSNYNLLAHLLGDTPVAPAGQQLVSPRVYEFRDLETGLEANLLIQPFATVREGFNFNPQCLTQIPHDLLPISFSSVPHNNSFCSSPSTGLPIGPNLRNFLNDPLMGAKFDLDLPFSDPNVILTTNSAATRIRRDDNSNLVPGDARAWHLAADFMQSGDRSVAFDVLAPKRGVIVEAANGNNNGVISMVHTADNGVEFLTVYTHINPDTRPHFDPGDVVERGDILGQTRTNMNTPHLHFGVAVKGPGGKIGGVIIPEAWYLVDPFGVYDYRRRDVAETSANEENYLPGNTLESPISQQRHAAVFNSPDDISKSLQSALAINGGILPQTQNTTCTTAPQLTGIQENSVLQPDSTTFKWTSNGCHYWVYAGDAPDRNNYHNESLAGGTEVTVSGYPSNGGELYLTLLYRNTNIVGAAWERAYFRFELPQSGICTVPPMLLSHFDGATLNHGSDTISWTSYGCHYWAWVGDGPDRNNYHNQSLAGATSVNLSGYPSDGSQIYMTLLYRNTNIVGAPWNREYFTFILPLD